MFRAAFRHHFGLGPDDGVPDRKTILLWVTTFRATGSVLKRKPPGRPRSVRTPDIVDAVRQSVLQSPKCSFRKHASDLGLSDRTVRRILHYDVNVLHPNEMMVDHHQDKELEEPDWENRMAAESKDNNISSDTKTEQGNPRSVMESVKVGMKRKNVPSSSKAQAKKKARKQSSPSETYSHWLIKSEPGSRYEKGIDMKFSFDDLKSSPDQIASWDGVRNYQARNFLRDQMKLDHEAFFYHSNCKNPGIVGICKVVRESYPDHTQFDSDNPHYDRTSLENNPKWFMVDVKYERPLNRFISLAELKKIHQEHAKSGGPLQNMALFTRARLSVQPLTQEEWDFIIHLEDKEPGSVEDNETVNGSIESHSLLLSKNIKLEPDCEADNVESSTRESISETQVFDKMNSEIPASVKVEKPEVCVDYADEDMSQRKWTTAHLSGPQSGSRA